MSTLLRAWRVVTRQRGRPFADGLGPLPAAPSGRAPVAPDPGTAPPPRAVEVNAGTRYPTQRRVLGHHRGEPTMAYLIELHRTPDALVAPPGGRCAALVRPADDADAPSPSRPVSSAEVDHPRPASPPRGTAPSCASPFRARPPPDGTRTSSARTSPRSTSPGASASSTRPDVPPTRTSSPSSPRRRRPRGDARGGGRTPRDGGVTPPRRRPGRHLRAIGGARGGGGGVRVRPALAPRASVRRRLAPRRVGAHAAPRALRPSIRRGGSKHRGRAGVRVERPPRATLLRRRAPRETIRSRSRRSRRREREERERERE